MTADVFLDTNVLLYAALGREDEPAKHEAAVRLLAVTDFGTSAQVLAEFYTNAIRKGSTPLTEDEASEWVGQLRRKPCQPVTSEIVMAGIELSRRYQLSYWDGAVLAAAERLGAAVVYSEDLNHGQTYGSVRVENPFLPA